MSFLEKLSIDKKLSIIRSINYNENMMNINTLPADVLRYKIENT
jgi:hypothetical protein